MFFHITIIEYFSFGIKIKVKYGVEILAKKLYNPKSVWLERRKRFQQVEWENLQTNYEKKSKFF